MKKVPWICAGLVLFAAAGLAESWTTKVSDRLVEGQVTLPDGHRVGFTVWDGEMFKVRRDEAGFFFGFSPYVDAESGRVRVKIWEITEQGPGLESLRILDLLELEPTFAAASEKLPDFTIEITGIRSHRGPLTAKPDAASELSGRISGRVVLAGGKEIRFTELDGGTVTVLQAGGPGYGITPRIVGQNEVSVQIWQIRDADPESRELVDRLSLAAGESAFAGKLAELEVEILEIRGGRPSTVEFKGSDEAPAVDPESLKAGSGKCCVTCDGTKSCATCKVEDTCGSCCTPSCCDEEL